MSDVSDEEYMDGVGKFIKIAPFNPKDIDLSKPPTTGEEFLQRVILEKRAVKSKSVKLERSSLANHIDDSMDIAENEPDTNTAKLPSKEWCTEQMLVFSELRCKADQTKSEIAQGRLQVEIMDSRLFSSDDYCHQLISTHQPIQSLLVKFNQVALEALLENLSESLVTNRVSIGHLGKWIYAVMVYLETPLVPEMHHSLRTIAKHCRSVRQETEVSDVENMNALNLFITIVSQFFGQTDLGDMAV